MEPVQYVRVLSRRWYLIAAFVLVGAGIGWVTASAAEDEAPTSVFYASHTLLAENNNSSLSRTGYLATVGEVPERVANVVGGVDPEQLATEIIVIADTNLGTLQIATAQPTRERAAAVADTYAAQLIAYLVEQRAASRQAASEDALAELDQLNARIDELDASLSGSDDPVLRAERDAVVNQYRLAYERVQSLVADDSSAVPFTTLSSARPVRSYGNVLGEQLNKAKANSQSTNSNRQNSVQTFVAPRIEDQDEPVPAEPISEPVRAAAGGALGLFLSIGIVLLLDRFDTRIRTARGAEAVFGVPVLSEIVALPRGTRKREEIAFLVEPAGVVADGYRRLRTGVRMGRPPIIDVQTNGNGHSSLTTLWARRPIHEGTAPVVLVTSASASEGKTTVAANLAAAFAELGARVLVVDGDVRRPQLANHLRPQNSRPVADQLVADDEVSLDDVAVATSVPGVWMLQLTDESSRAANPTAMLAALSNLLDEARSLADVIIVDTAPLLAASDVDDLLPEADLVLLAAQSGQTKQDSARRTSELLVRAGAPLIGVVLTGSQSSAGSEVYFTEPRRRRRDLREVIDFDAVADTFSAFSASSPGPDQPLWRQPHPDEIPSYVMAGTATHPAPAQGSSPTSSSTVGGVTTARPNEGSGAPEDDRRRWVLRTARRDDA